MNRPSASTRESPLRKVIRRIARGQLDQAEAELKNAPKRKLAAAVHDTRKSLKRLRATVRLGRDALGEETYKRENQAFRDTGRRLAGVRDASVLIETLDALEQATPGELPSDATAGLRERLEAERKQALQSLKDDDAAIDGVCDDLDQARTRTATWTFEADGFAALEPGLQAHLRARAKGDERRGGGAEHRQPPRVAQAREGPLARRADPSRSVPEEDEEAGQANT